MIQNKQKNIIDALKDFDTPAITNVIGSYPGESFCLGLLSLERQLVYRSDDSLYVS